MKVKQVQNKMQKNKTRQMDIYDYWGNPSSLSARYYRSTPMPIGEIGCDWGETG